MQAVVQDQAVGIGSGCTRWHSDLTSFLEDGWADDADNNHTADNQRNGDERDQEDAASACGKFPSDDPIL